MRNLKREVTRFNDDFFDKFFEEEQRINLVQYLRNSFCDEIGEIDLVNDTCRLFQHIEHKYIVPYSNGTYSEIFQYIISNLVYPEDVQNYTRDFSPSTILDNLKNSKHKNFSTFRYRYKLASGDYHWLEAVLLTGKEYNIKENVIHFYIYDIDRYINAKKAEYIDEDIAEKERNPISNLYLETPFYENAVKLMNKHKHKKWALIAIDIEHFKIFNEWYGMEKGNQFLKKIGDILASYKENHLAMAAHYGQDDFVLLCEYNEKEIEHLYQEFILALSSFGVYSGFKPLFGVYFIHPKQDIGDAYNKATIAAVRSRKVMGEHIQIYDENYYVEAEQEHLIISNFFNAMKNKEITFYLQPQCRISNKKIVGAEALARWIDKDGSIISPTIFVPILEKYGFITDLDKYIWNEVCKWISSQIKKNKEIVPISINVSKLDIFNIDLSEYFLELVKKYNIPISSLKIEITESAYAENSEYISHVVSKLRESGFKVLMDDFGSGYSSLNMLSTIEIDTIKLDALFLKFKDEAIEKSIHILESMINMAKQLGIPIIVEGVENIEQVNFLKNTGCRYAQGFYFYKPVSIKEFEKLISSKNILDPNGIHLKSNEQFRIKEFLDSNIYSDSMLNNILGAVALYSFNGKETDIIRYNQQFYESVGVPDFAERLANIERFTHPDDISLLHNALNEAVANKLNGAWANIRFYKTDGTLSSYHLHFYFIRKKDNGENIYYGSARNVTELAILKEELNLLSNITDRTIIFVKKFYDSWDYDIAINGVGRYVNLNKEQVEEELRNDKLFKRLSKEDALAIKTIIEESHNDKTSVTHTFLFKGNNKSKIKIKMEAIPIYEDVENIQYIVVLSVIKN